jgi:hypothetical protein
MPVRSAAVPLRRPAVPWQDAAVPLRAAVVPLRVAAVPLRVTEPHAPSVSAGARGPARVEQAEVRVGGGLPLIHLRRFC